MLLRWADTIVRLPAELSLILIKNKDSLSDGGDAMVRVSFLILMSLLLSSCAVDQQQGSDSLAQDLWDCIPNPTLADVWSCASKKKGSATAPAFETKTINQRAS
jgi:hypothetical protein